MITKKRILILLIAPVFLFLGVSCLNYYLQIKFANDLFKNLTSESYETRNETVRRILGHYNIDGLLGDEKISVIKQNRYELNEKLGRSGRRRLKELVFQEVAIYKKPEIIGGFLHLILANFGDINLYGELITNEDMESIRDSVEKFNEALMSRTSRYTLVTLEDGRVRLGIGGTMH